MVALSNEQLNQFPQRHDALEADRDAYRRCVRAMLANRHHYARCVACGIGGLDCATGDAARAEEQAAIAALPVGTV